MLARFEKLVEQAVEGSLRRVFPTTVQPVQLAKAAARAMEDAQVIGLHGAEVPNKYELQLAPDDLERFGDYASTLCDEVSRYLADYARDRGLRLVAEPRVELQPDAYVRAGSVRAQARFVDLAPPTRREIDAAVEGTRRLRLADLAEARAASPAVTERGMWLEDRLGLRAPLDPQMGIVRLGRATDNDVVIANQRVSRYHAQLRWVESSWLVYDLDSTNGTWVDDQRVFPSQPRVFGSSAQLRLGDHELRAAAE
jgi:FHA domain-containing protein